jgi:hypothetical protein
MTKYNFIAMTERPDESLVGLQMQLDVPCYIDLLQLRTQTSGRYDNGRYRDKGYNIFPKFVGPGMQEFFSISRMANETSAWHCIVHAADMALDMTIGQGDYEEFQKRLEAFQQKQIESAISEKLPRGTLDCC